MPYFRFKLPHRNDPNVQHTHLIFQGVNAIGDSDDEDFGVTKKRRRQVISDDESDEDEGVENEAAEAEQSLALSKEKLRLRNRSKEFAR